MKIKCKPVYNFQSVEFEYEVDSPEQLNDMFSLYDEILTGLENVSRDQPSPGKPSEPKASDKQINTLKKLGVDEKEAKRMTMKEASQTIKELIGDK